MISIVTLAGKEFLFLYSFQLFSIISLFDILMIVIKTLYYRGLQFISTAVLLVIFIWFFAGTAFFWLKALYERPALRENVCESYFRCFLTYLNYGIRTNGPFDMPQYLPYSNRNYYKAFFFDWSFFFIIMLILLNIVNAIIVDSFQNFREDDTQAKNEENNLCYVCNLHRAKFEMKGFNYENHVNKEHNLLNYIRYMIGLRLRDKYELNSVQSGILKKIDAEQIEFIPFKMALSLQ